MNLQQFLSQQPIDSLIHQYFSLEGQSQKTKSQQTTLINSIVLYIGSQNNYTFNQLYQQCQYQLQVNNQQRQSINKMCKLLIGVLNKASYLLKNINIIMLVDNVLEFLMSKVFVTLCSADCIKCIWALINAYMVNYPLESQVVKKLEISSKKGGCCGGKQQVKSTKQQGCCGATTKQTGCCNDSKPKQQKSSGGCCGGNSNSQPTSVQKSRLLQLIKNHQKICHLLITKLFKTFKLHIKGYPFKVRKDIFKILHYVLKFIQFSNPNLQSLLNKSQSILINTQSKPLFVQLNATKQQLIQIVIKNLVDQKDPRNMTLIFQNYYLLIQLFSPQITQLNYKKQIFQNLQVYYPLSMQGDQQGFDIDSQDMFKQKDLIKLLDDCFLQEMFKDEVRQMLIEKMLAPPLHEYVSLYIKYITKFNPNVNKKLLNDLNQQQVKQEKNKFLILTMNLLVRLCEQDYLQQNYGGGGCCQGEQNSHQCQDSSCKPSKKCGSQPAFSISQLISTIIQNVFISTFNQQQNYMIYSHEYQKKFVQFLNNLIITKIFNHTENNKHAGTIIQIVKVILDGKLQTYSKQSNVSKEKGCCSSQQSCSTLKCCNEYVNTINKRSIYGKKFNYQQILINFVIHKFMQFWLAKGDIAFKLGILIIVLNKKYQNVSIQRQSLNLINTCQILDLNSQNLFQHLLISLGNIYQNHKQTDQIKIMVLKVLMLIASIYKKASITKQAYQKNLMKIKKINNSIVFKDCVKVGQLLKSTSEKAQNNNSSEIKQSKAPSEQPNQFSKSQIPILKSYVDYIMELYFNCLTHDQISELNQQTFQLLKNILNFSSTTLQAVNNDNKKDVQKIQRYFDVKFYALIRFMSYFHKSDYQNNNQEKQNLSAKKNKLKDQIFRSSELIFCIWTSNNSRLNQKFTQLNRFYTYQTLLSIFVLVLRTLFTSSFSQSNFFNKNQDYQIFFINISLFGKQLSKKFQDFYQVSLEYKPYNYIDLVKIDIQKHIQHSMEKEESSFISTLSWYLLKKVWQKCIIDDKGKQYLYTAMNNEIEVESIIQQNPQLKSFKQIQSDAKLRITQLSNLLSLSQSLEQFNIASMSSLSYSDLTTKLLYVRYLQINKIDRELKFNSKIVKLYDNGMIEYFWNRLLNTLVYSEKSMIEEEIKNELVELIEYIPEKLMKLHAEKIVPVIIYSSQQKTSQQGQEKMIEQKFQKKLVDKFDFTKTLLISKIAPNLPQQSIILNVIPFCLQLMKISALDCQNNSNNLQIILKSQNAVETTLNNNKILYILIQKSEQTLQSQKKSKYEKLKKSLFETHKKQFNQYLSRLIYHKKRVIRQSARNLLMSFQ